MLGLEYSIITSERPTACDSSQDGLAAGVEICALIKLEKHINSENVKILIPFFFIIFCLIFNV
jgi:hypothetical protein